jgi:CHAD domain-containing protein
MEQIIEARREPRASERPLDLRAARGFEDSPSLADHIAALVDKRLRRLAESAKFADSEDPVETLHDLRVASRRIRAFIDVFDPLLDPHISKRAGKQIRRITRAAGELRDWDVQRERLEKRLQVADTDSERAALEHVLEHVDEERRQTERRVKKKLGRVDLETVHRTVLAALGEAIAHMAAPGPGTLEFAWVTLASRVEEVSFDHAGDADTRATRMHLMRVELKRLRYALELFEPIVGPKYDELYSRVVELQDLLGAHHDLVVLGEFVAEQRGTLEKNRRETLKQGLVRLESQLRTERGELERRFAVSGFDGAAFLDALRVALTHRNAEKPPDPEPLALPEP